MKRVRAPLRVKSGACSCNTPVTSARALAEHLELTEDERLGAERAERAEFPISVTPYYLGLVDRATRHAPFDDKSVPSLRESEIGCGRSARSLG